jgi:predicted metal-dependent hydrolase
MIVKKKKVADLIQNCHGRGVDPHYAGYFEYFNRGLFYEAHDVLEQLWLAERRGPNYGFYKGLIQLAGAFVHLQKNRPGPAAALFKLAHGNLAKYPSRHEQLDVQRVLTLIEDWQTRLQEGRGADNPLAAAAPPKIVL